jgi:hypothetical protein
VAIWQLKLHLVPRERVLAIFGTLPVTVPGQILDETRWFRETPAEFENGISSLLVFKHFASDTICYWGEADCEEGVVTYEDGRLSSVELRIDARNASPQYILDLCAFVRRLDCLLVEHRTKQLVEPEFAAVLATLRRSTAAKFVADPRGTLLSRVPMASVVSDRSGHRIRHWLGWVRRWVRPLHR